MLDLFKYNLIEIGLNENLKLSIFQLIKLKIWQYDVIHKLNSSAFNC